MMLWRKRVIGVLLLPAVLALVVTGLDLLRQWMGQGEWSGLPFLSFALGVLIWLVVFFTLPKTLWLYVFGHELTHALAAYLAGGKVYRWKISKTGGQVVTDRINWWIALAPYFIPIYSLLYLSLWLVVDFYWPLGRIEWLLYGGLGITWAFHASFTVSMINLGQSDLKGQGHFFSMVVIVGINLLLLLVSLIAVSKGLRWSESFSVLGGDLLWAYRQAAWWLMAGASKLWELATSIFALFHTGSRGNVLG